MFFFPENKMSIHSCLSIPNCRIYICIHSRVTTAVLTLRYLSVLPPPDRGCNKIEQALDRIPENFVSMHSCYPLGPKRRSDDLHVYRGKMLAENSGHVQRRDITYSHSSYFFLFFSFLSLSFLRIRVHLLSFSHSTLVRSFFPLVFKVQRVKGESACTKITRYPD